MGNIKKLLMGQSFSRNSVIALFLILLPLFLYQSALAAEIRLVWDPNSETDLAGYKVYYGTSERTGTDPNSCGLCGYSTSVNVGNVTTHTITGLTLGQTYFTSVTAYNASGESSYSNEVLGTANDPPITPETVNAPGVLGGPTGGTTGTSYSYTTGGSSSNLGHSVEYQFDWKGDGSDLSPWGSATQSKTWNTTGIYNVRARARCVTDTLVVSSWSGNFSVSIESVSNPTTLSGPNSGAVGAICIYSTGGSSSGLGHSIQYFFDWGDGTSSGWLPVGTTSGSKSWTTAGTYSVKAQARCAIHTSAISGWSGPLAVSISNTPVFSDVPLEYWAYDYINAIYNAHFTIGCAQNPLKYCPEDSVTRGQMAAFIVRAKFGENFSYTTTPYFSDVPATHIFFKYVQKLKDSNITVVSGTYGVDDIVTRAQMAAFLARGFLGMQ